MPIIYPENHPHPAFPDQREYALCRAVIDTGDEAEEATAVLTFRHKESGRLRRFKFSGVHFAGGYLAGLRSYPFYVATTQGRGWASGSEVEVGESDPGDEWFWAAEVEEVDQPAE